MRGHARRPQARHDHDHVVGAGAVPDPRPDPGRVLRPPRTALTRRMSRTGFRRVARGRSRRGRTSIPPRPSRRSWGDRAHLGRRHHRRHGPSRTSSCPTPSRTRVARSSWSSTRVTRTRPRQGRRRRGRIRPEPDERSRSQQVLAAGAGPGAGRLRAGDQGGVRGRWRRPIGASTPSSSLRPNCPETLRPARRSDRVEAAVLTRSAPTA